MFNNKPEITTKVYNKAYNESMEKAYVRYGKQTVNTQPRLKDACIYYANKDGQRAVANYR